MSVVAVQLVRWSAASSWWVKEFGGDASGLRDTPERSEQVYRNRRIKPAESGRVGGQCWPAALAAGVDDPASEDVEGIGGLERPFDRCGVGATKSAHDDVRMVHEVIKEHTGLGSQNLDFGDGQRWQKVGQATDTGSTQPRAERDAAAGPRGDGTRIEDICLRPRVRAGSAGVRNEVIMTNHVITGPRPPTALIDLAVVRQRRCAEALSLAPFDGESPLVAISLVHLCSGRRHDVGDGLPVAHEVHEHHPGRHVRSLQRAPGGRRATPRMLRSRVAP